MSPRGGRAVAASLALLIVLAAAGAAAGGPCTFDGAPRVVAIGDVHGAYDLLLELLRAAGVADAKGRWTGGTTHLVQLGDVVDRCTETRRCLELLMRLEGDAEKAGGRLHALLGNHEVMNIVGDLRYVNPREYNKFRTPQSEQLRRSLYERLLPAAREAAKERGEKFDESAFQAGFEAQTPPGFVERTQALSAEGRYGRWLRARPVLVVVNGVAFVHGGVTPETAALGCHGINEGVRHELGKDLARTREDPTRTLAAGSRGPLWYRGLAREDEVAFAPALERALQSLGARAVVVGHTVTTSGRIEARFGGRVVMIDAGMAEEYGGHAAALEIDAQGRMTAVYLGGREPLAVSAKAASYGGWTHGAGGRVLESGARPTAR